MMNLSILLLDTFTGKNLYSPIWLSPSLVVSKNSCKKEKNPQLQGFLSLQEKTGLDPVLRTL